MLQKKTVCYLASAKSVHTKRWATHFSRLGYRVHVVSFDKGDIPGVEVHHISPPVSFKPLGLPLTLHKVKRILRTIRPDILHAHYATSYGLIGALTGFKPLIVTAWGTDVLIMPRKSRLIRGILLWSLGKANLITSMAAHMTAVLKGLGVDDKKIVTLPFGVDTAVFHPGLRAEEEDIDIICTRPCEPIYNVELLIRSLPHIVARYPNLRCVLIGGGLQEQNLKALAKELGLEAHIQWVGRVSLPDVAKWLGRAKVFVSPSLSDGNNISLNEAMACGCFPVCTDIPANREWLEDGHNGYLVPVDRPEVLAEHIILARSAHEFRRQCAVKNWRIVQDRADWNKNMARMNTYYIALTSGCTTEK
jgi:glycosyltransferase involved in cell wall biosynthesis